MTDITVGSVAVDVVPDASSFRRRLDADLQGLRAEVSLDLNDTDLRARLTEATRARSVALNVNADTAAAEAQIDAAARNRSVKIDSDGASQGLSTLTAAALALGPALVPITAAVVGLGVALAAPVAAAGGGLTVFGVLAGFAVKQTTAQQKQIQALAKQVAAARVSLRDANAAASTSAANTAASAQRTASASIASAQRSANLSLASAKQSERSSIASAQQALAAATTKAGRAAALQRIQAAKAAFAARQASIQQSLANSRASASTSLANSQAGAAASQSATQTAAQRKLNDALEQYHLALKALTPEQKKFLAAKDDLKGSFENLIESSGPSLLGPLTSGMDALAGLLPKVSPLLDGVASGITTLLDDVSKATSGPGFKSFMDAFGQKAQQAIVQFGRIAGNIGTGLAGVFGGFGPLASSFMSSLVGMSQRFADFGKKAGKSEGLHSFVAYVQQIGPKVAATFGSVVGAIGKIAVAVAPIGGVALAAIKGFADAIRVIPTPILTTVAAGAAALAVSLKAIALAKAGITGLQTLGATISGLGRSNAAASLTKTQTAVRGLAGVGGLGLLTASAQTSNKALGILGNAAGGAMIGSAFGPLGIAVGGVGGALLGVWQQSRKSTNAFKDAIPTVDDYAASLDNLTVKTTAQMRVEALKSLNKSGALAAGLRRGLDPKTLVDAALGQARAQTKVNVAVVEGKRQYEKYLTAAQQSGGAYGAKMLNKANAIKDDLNTINVVIGQNVTNIDKAKRQALLFRQGLGLVAKDLKGFPKAAITKVQLDGYPQSIRQIAKLGAEYNLTPKQIHTLMTIGGVTGSILDVERIIAAIRAVPKKPKVEFDVTAHYSKAAKDLMRKQGLSGTGYVPAGNLTPRAAGGPVNTGQTYLVGERGPEIFTPAHSGRIIPNGASTGPQFVVQQVVAQDVNDFLTQMQTRARHSAFDGVQRASA